MSAPVTTSWTTIAGSAGAFDAYLALPPAGRGPGLLLYQEIFGVNEHIRSVAEQYALDGFVVLAPDVFWQQQRRLEIGYTPEDIQRGRALAMAADRDALRRDLADGAKALRALPQVQGRGIGAIGYCMGGRLAYVAAATAGVDAAVAYYGGGIQDMLDLAPAIACPMQFHYGALDANIPLSAVDKVRAAMQGREAEIHVYDAADHGFNCWARSSYRAASAALAHGRTLQFLATTLF
ncbi:MAG: putative dienelactone hydrolase [Proteobacteria bacterium]|jgi:carboxymethylenebutenolidase|nr:putative dienelactone hydrolase [Pseudomonadota bacterium]